MASADTSNARAVDSNSGSTAVACPMSGRRSAMFTGAVSMLLRVLCAAKRNAVVVAHPSRIAARGKAVDVGRLASDVAHAFAAESLELVAFHAFTLEKIAFVFRSAGGVLTEAAAGGDDAVAGEDDRYRVASHDVADRARRFRPAHFARQPRIRAHFAAR